MVKAAASASRIFAGRAMRLAWKSRPAVPVTGVRKSGGASTRAARPRVVRGSAPPRRDRLLRYQTVKLPR